MRLIVALLMISGTARAAEVALDSGAAVWDGVVFDAKLDAVADTGVPWVRLNFRLDVWSSPDDPVRRGPSQLTWFEVYDRLVDGYLARGIQVYGLINDEAVGSSAPRASDAFVDAYVTSARTIVDHFKDRVRVWELFNEPNDWAGGSSPRLPAYWFAKLLEKSYRAIKIDGGRAADRCSQVTLVSGPLFSFDGTTAADYLQQTYTAGRTQLRWNTLVPLDGIGYHAYVAQDPGDSLQTVKSAISGNLAAIWNVVSAEEGAGSGKRIWMSEFGWRADRVGAAGQADRLQAAVEAMDSQGHVAAAFWFTLQDFPDNQWGLYTGNGLAAADKRLAADRLRTLSVSYRPGLRAHVTHISAVAIATGQTGEVLVTLENRGADTWSSEFRLGAAPGCPESTATNALTWEPVSGYANGLTDARVFLPADVPPGASVTLPVRVRAAAPGVYRFAARMVHEGVAWFGSTAQTDVTVSPASAPFDPQPDPGAMTGDPAAPGGSGAAGCSAAAGAPAGGVLFMLMMGILFWCTRFSTFRTTKRPASAKPARRST